MPSLFPFDIAIASWLIFRRYGVAKTFVLSFVLMPIYLWSLPPVSCGCFGPMFRRCDRSIVYEAAMKSDLKNLASQQEIYFSDAASYTVDFDALAYVTSDGVHVEVFATESMWEARATHAATGEERACTIYYGGDPVNVVGEMLGKQPGEVACSD